MRYHVFISYSHEDVRAAETLQAHLEERSFTCWRDPRIGWGAEFPVELERAIADSQATVVLVSRSSARSEWVHKEIAIARENKRPVLPLLLDNRTLPRKFSAAFGSTHYIQVTTASIAQQVETIAAELERAGVGSLTDPVDKQLDVKVLSGSFAGLDPGRLQQLDAMAALAGDTFHGTPGNELWTVHGLRHSNGILRRLAALAPERVREDEHATFCLAAAACLHDIGLVVWRTGSQGTPATHPRLNGEQGSGAHQCDDGPAFRREIDRLRRRDHHVCSRQMAYDLAGELELTGREADLIADLCFYHNGRTNAQAIASGPEAAELVGLFRIANACDVGPLRAPQYFWDFNVKRIAGAVSHKPDTETHTAPPDDRDAIATFWLKNLLIDRVDIDPGGRDIVCHLISPMTELDFVPDKIYRYIAELVHDLLPCVGEWHVRPRTSYRNEIAHGLDVRDMVQFGAGLYSDQLSVVRSSGDIFDYLLSAVIALTSETYLERREPHSADGSGLGDIAQTLDALARDLPKQHPELHALQWLAREYRRHRSPDQPNRAKLRAINLRFADIKRRRRFCPAAGDLPGFTGLAARAWTALVEKFEKDGGCAGHGAPDELRFFVFGHSGPVSVFLEYCIAAGKTVRVFTPTMRPVGEGPTLKVYEELSKREHIAVELIPDAAIPMVLRGDGDRPQCHLALMGCEAILNGRVSGTPEIANSLGCRAIAELVRTAGVELWVLTEALKQEGDSSVSCWARGSGRKPPELPTVAFMQEPAASHIAGDSDALYPRSEIVPGRLISRIMSDTPLRPECRLAHSSGSIIAFDIDDTLMPVNQPAADATIAGLRRLADAGAHIVFASGKPCLYLSGLARGLDLMDCSLIGENGAEVWVGSTMPPERLSIAPTEEEAAALASVRVAVEARYGDNVFFQPNAVGVTAFPRPGTVTPDDIARDIHPPLPDSIQRFIHTDSVDWAVSRFNKGAALKGLATRLGVPMDRVAVAGDSGNDLSMVDVAAVSVWLGNPARLEGRQAQCLGSIDAALAVLDETVASWT